MTSTPSAFEPSIQLTSQASPRHAAAHAISTEMADTVVYQVEIAPFFCPIDPVMHPRVRDVEQASADWAMQIGLCQTEAQLARWRGTNSATFYAGMTPHGIVERLQVAVDWVYWGFSFDDHRCDEGSNAIDPTRFVPVASRLLRILETQDAALCGQDPYLLGLHDLARRYHELGTAVQARRWVVAHMLWLSGVIQQNTHRAHGGPTRVDDYIATRIHDCGGPPTQSMYEFVNGAEVPGSEMDSPPVRAITELFWLIAGLDNDRVSRHKEILGQHDSYNLVDIIARCQNRCEQDAAQQMIAYRDRLMCLFLRLRDQLAHGASAPLLTYLKSLEHGIRSNIDWSLTVPRYKTVYARDGVTQTAQITLASRCVEQPTDDCLEPLPWPSVAWWWTQLD
jgi:Terpene synthase family 2, C-terminal metal binding